MRSPFSDRILGLDCCSATNLYNVRQQDEDTKFSFPSFLSLSTFPDCVFIVSVSGRLNISFCFPGIVKPLSYEQTSSWKARFSQIKGVEGAHYYSVQRIKPIFIDLIQKRKLLSKLILWCPFRINILLQLRHSFNKINHLIDVCHVFKKCSIGRIDVCYMISLVT